MSKISKQITQNKSVRYDVVTSITCDICHRIYDGDRWPHVAGNNIQETEMTCKIGWDAPYNGGGMYQQFTYDICPQCFIDKLKPLLEQTYGSVPENQRNRVLIQNP